MLVTVSTDGRGLPVTDTTSAGRGIPVDVVGDRGTVVTVVANGTPVFVTSGSLGGGPAPTNVVTYMGENVTYQGSDVTYG